MTRRLLASCSTTVVFVFLGAAVAVACVPGIETLDDYVWPTGQDVSVCVWPDGRPARAFVAGGGEVEADLRFRVVDFSGQPVADMPMPNAAWFMSSGPGALCPDPFAGLASDTDGWVTLRFSGGGQRGPGVAGPFVLIVDACPTLELVLPENVWFNSPDLTGDLRVDLSDTPLFAADFFAASAAYRSDFNWDGQVNLSDLVVMAEALGAHCP